MVQDLAHVCIAVAAATDLAAVGLVPSVLNARPWRLRRARWGGCHGANSIELWDVERRR